MAGAHATASRGPDILVRAAPPLSATTDVPLAEVAKPPASASNNAADQAAGVPTEMSPEAQAEARAARSAKVGVDLGKPGADRKLAVKVNEAAIPQRISAAEIEASVFSPICRPQRQPGVIVALWRSRQLLGS